MAKDKVTRTTPSGKGAKTKLSPTSPVTRKPLKQATVSADFVVGIGASAGGLEALQAFVGHLPANSTMSYVVAQHLSPQHRSMMVELLARHSRIRVAPVIDGTIPQPNVIYVTPPDEDVFIREGRLRLRKPQATIGPKPSVDYFFTTLANELHDRSIGVVLSGTGSDGSHGMRAIKAAGGITIAQEPKSAKYDSMPLSAIRGGLADLVLAPDQIAKQLPAIVSSPRPVIVGSADQGHSVYRLILERLYQKHQVDFREYKEATLQRQLERRLTALQLPGLREYLDYIDKNPVELEQLIQRFLISVTSFFRDSEHFYALRAALRQIINRDAKTKQLRIWVPGCATGEEPYSIAILLSEELGISIHDYDITIFATDIDVRATELARRGIYPETAFADVSADLMQKYFDKQGRSYIVKKFLRELIVFARHDLIQDPPFLQIDLVSCRNLLIYFKNDLQAKTFAFFHYALRDDGYLFLGKSETTVHGSDLFKVVDAKHRIYQRNAAASSREMSGRSSIFRAPTQLSKRRANSNHGVDHYAQLLVTAYAPPTAMVTGDGNCVHYFSDLTLYTTAPPGTPSVNLVAIVQPRLRTDVRALLNRARTTNELAVGHYQTIRIGSEDKQVRISVRPVEGQTDTNNLFFVSFETQLKPALMPAGSMEPSATISDGQDSESLEAELSQTRQHLQSVIEELETANEELQSLNEELQSSAEELQSTNEELETANEELQASNEELSTVNEELQTKSSELGEINDLLETVQISLDVPMVLVDMQLQILRYTPTAIRIFDIQASDIGRPITQLRRRFRIRNLTRRLTRVTSTGEIEQEAVKASDKNYQLRITPFRDGLGNIRGALLAFTDVTQLIQMGDDLRASEHRFALMLDQSPLAKIAVNIEGQIIIVNERAETLFGYRKPDVLGQPIESLIPAGLRDELTRYRAAYSPNLQRQNMVLGLDLVALHKSGKRFPVEISLSSIQTDQGLMVLCGIVDISERKLAERSLRERAEALDRSNRTLKEFAYVASHDLQEPLRMITGHLQLLSRRHMEQLDEKARRYLDYAVDGAKRMQSLISGLLMYERIGSAEPTFARVEMTEIMSQVVTDLGRQIHDSRAIVTHDKLPAVKANAVQCRQLLQNLISNAIKFRSEAAPRIHVSAAQEADQCVFSVRDNGIGIAPEHRNRVFAVFQRLHTREEFPGEGLGLSICKRIVELHGGTIRVDAAPDQGSIFYFTLPKLEE